MGLAEHIQKNRGKTVRAQFKGPGWEGTPFNVTIVDEPALSEDERRLVVRVRDYLRWYDTQPAADWTVRTLEAIREDRESEDYRNDPDALPSGSHLQRDR